MILTKYVDLRVTSKLLNYYKQLGYVFNYGDIIKIDINHLTNGSHIKVDIECDYCKSIFNIEFRGCYEHINNLYECKSCISKRLIDSGVRKKFNKETNKIINDNKKEKMKDIDYKNNIISKTKKTKLERYGDETYNNQNKRKKTLFSNHGSDTFSNREKARNTMIELYGKYYNNQEKKKETIFSKYGVYHTNHVEYIFNKMQISSFKIKKYNDSIMYQGTYEKHFLDFCFDNNIYCEKFAGNIIYNETHRYYPDFYYPDLNLIIEIKSSYTFNKDLEKNISKRESCIREGYNFLFIIDRDYNEFKKIINKI